MTINEMRREISKVYSNDTWRNRVHFMPDRQVAAIYYNFLERDKFRKVEKHDINKKEPHQMTLGEYFGRDIFPV